jgi:hypothetical protein
MIAMGVLRHRSATEAHRKKNIMRSSPAGATYNNDGQNPSDDTHNI